MSFVSVSFLFIPLLKSFAFISLKLHLSNVWSKPDGHTLGFYVFGLDRAWLLKCFNMNEYQMLRSLSMLDLIALTHSNH